MTVKKFIALSLVAHAVIFLCIYFIKIKDAERKKGGEYVTAMITPEEEKKETPPVPVPAKPRPRFGERRSVPLVPALPHKTIPPPPNVKPKDLPSPEIPVGAEAAGPAGPRTGDLLPVERGAGNTSLPRKETGIAADGKRRPYAGRPVFSEKGNYLFDSGVTENIAMRDTKKGGRPGDKDNPVTFDIRPYEYGPYMELLRKKIESIWVYPPEAAARNIYGDLKIQFTIKKDGRLGEVKLVRTSGYKMLDDAALRALKEGEAYWPLPDEWHKDSYTILGHFIYSLYGQHLK